MIPQEYPESLQSVLALWNDRASKYLGWHGIGLSGSKDSPIYTFFFEPDADENPLMRVAGHLPGSPPSEILKIRLFRQIKSKIFEEVLGKSAEPLTAGGEVFARNQKCGCGPHGTIGAFLQDANQQGPIWLLSNYHILARGSDCESPVEVFGSSRDPVSNKIIPIELKYKIDPIGNIADAAIAKLNSTSIDPVHPGLTVTTAQPVTPQTGSILQKLGPGVSVAKGILMYWCPRIELFIDDSDVNLTVFNNQMVIGSIPGDVPFVTSGDSGSLVVAVDQNKVVSPAGLLFVITTFRKRSTLVDQSSANIPAVDPFGIASPIGPMLQQFSDLVGSPLQIVLPRHGKKIGT